MEKNDYITKEYLDESIKKILDEIRLENAIFREDIRHTIKAMTEQVPTYDGVRKIVREEIAEALEPIETKLDIYTRETRSHGRRITRLEQKIA